MFTIDYDSKIIHILLPSSELLISKLDRQRQHLTKNYIVTAGIVTRHKTHPMRKRAYLVATPFVGSNSFSCMGKGSIVHPECQIWEVFFIGLQ